jgi:hypothetical protein
VSDFLTLLRRLTRDRPYLHFCALMVVFKIFLVPITQACGAMYLEMAAALSAGEGCQSQASLYMFLDCSPEWKFAIMK